MAEIKVLALDLDGTLTNSQKEVTPRTRAARSSPPLSQGPSRLQLGLQELQVQERPHQTAGTRCGRARGPQR